MMTNKGEASPHDASSLEQSNDRIMTEKRDDGDVSDKAGDAPEEKKDAGGSPRDYFVSTYWTNPWIRVTQH